MPSSLHTDILSGHYLVAGSQCWPAAMLLMASSCGAPCSAAFAELPNGNSLESVQGLENNLQQLRKIGQEQHATNTLDALAEVINMSTDSNETLAKCMANSNSTVTSGNLPTNSETVHQSNGHDVYTKAEVDKRLQHIMATLQAMNVHGKKLASLMEHHLDSANQSLLEIRVRLEKLETASAPQSMLRTFCWYLVITFVIGALLTVLERTRQLGVTISALSAKAWANSRAADGEELKCINDDVASTSLWSCSTTALTSARQRGIAITSESPKPRPAAKGVALGGAAGGFLGAGVGCATGTVVGLVPAFFTFGLSIPIGAAIGAGSGLFAGTAVGSAVGAGFAEYRWRQTQVGTQLQVLATSAEKVAAASNNTTSSIENIPPVAVTATHEQDNAVAEGTPAVSEDMSS